MSDKETLIAPSVFNLLPGGAEAINVCKAVDALAEQHGCLIAAIIFTKDGKSAITVSGDPPVPELRDMTKPENLPALFFNMAQMIFAAQRAQEAEDADPNKATQ